MFRSEGFIRLDSVRMAFEFINLEETDQTALRGKAKQDRLLEKRIHEHNIRERKRFGKVSRSEEVAPTVPSIDAQDPEYPEMVIPSSEEANRAIPDSEVPRSKLRALCSSAFTRFLSECSLHLCGPGGAVTPVDGSIMELHYVPLQCETFSARQTAKGSNGVVKIPPNQGCPWSFVDTTHYSVDCRDKLQELWEAREELSKRSGGPVPEMDLSRLQYLARLAPIAHGLLPFEGHVLVIPESEAPDRKIIQKHLGIRLESDAKPGRPAKKHLAATAYKELFPSGHGDMTHKEVLQKIRQHLGHAVDWRTLLKGLEAI
ncbi:hypothetical protein [Phaeobacter italicus]|uniref:hypothetical protein n=1 Tax=Phaeobacter italicus TaxID=481446 RepID=UPI001CD7D471|nr:hypothetical protein [Phaeobacter italicus]MCA0857277.1 hypothetical protein [Phaeobacter italicus]